ncbi:MAG TPA: hypothetical protein VGI81_29400 [Tepidisphaeraceae bacterium]|jgi:hypothetical protein
MVRILRQDHAGKGLLLTSVQHPKLGPHEWSRVERVVNAAAGTARMAIALQIDVDPTGDDRTPASKAP